MIPFDPATADLSDPTVREWVCMTVHALAVNLTPGNVVEVFYADTVEGFQWARKEREILPFEVRKGTNAEAAAWLEPHKAEIAAIDRRMEDERALAKPPWTYPGRGK